MENRQVAVEFWLGDTVYLRCRKERSPGLISAVVFQGTGATVYYATFGDGIERQHCGYELSREYIPDWERVE